MSQLTLLTTLMVMSLISACTAGDWCHLARQAVWGYNRGSGEPVFSKEVEAKAACEASEDCGGVGVDRVPFRVGGVAYRPTIYLLTVKDAARVPNYNPRYDTFLKGACSEE